MASKQVEEKKTSVDLEAVVKQLNSLSAVSRKIIAVLEKHFGIDIDRDGKVGKASIALVSLIGVLAIVGSVFAAPIVTWYDGDSVFGTAKIAGTGGTATLTVDAVVADITGDVTGDVTASLQTLTPSSVSLTNGQALTVSASLYLVSGIGGASGSTNTVTLANPTTVGDVVTLVAASTSTNVIAIADSGNVASAGAVDLGASDSVTLVGAATNLWVETARSDN